MINLFFQAQSAGRFRAVLPMGRDGIFSLQLGKFVYLPSSVLSLIFLSQEQRWVLGNCFVSNPCLRRTQSDPMVKLEKLLKRLSNRNRIEIQYNR